MYNAKDQDAENQKPTQIGYFERQMQQIMQMQIELFEKFIFPPDKKKTENLMKNAPIFSSKIQIILLKHINLKQDAFRDDMDNFIQYVDKLFDDTFGDNISYDINLFCMYKYLKNTYYSKLFIEQCYN